MTAKIFDIIEDEKERREVEKYVKEYRQKIIDSINKRGEFGEDEVLEMVFWYYRTDPFMTLTEAIFLSWTLCKYLYTSGYYTVIQNE